MTVRQFAYKYQWYISTIILVVGSIWFLYCVFSDSIPFGARIFGMDLALAMWFGSIIFPMYMMTIQDNEQTSEET